MEGYYDHGPRVSLGKPIGLIGFMGAGTAQVGHALASRFGLPLHELDRHVEHAAGMSLAALQLEHGIDARRAGERTALERSARDTPAGVVVLGDGALLDPDNQQLAVTSLRLVYLHRPLAVLRRAIELELKQAPARYPELVLHGEVPDEADLSAMLADRQPGYTRAHHTLDAGRLHPQRVCDALERELSLSLDP